MDHALSFPISGTGFSSQGEKELHSETLCEAQRPHMLPGAQASSRVRRWASLQGRPRAQHLLSLLGSLPIGAGRDSRPQPRHRLLETLARVTEVGGPLMPIESVHEDSRRQRG